MEILGMRKIWLEINTRTFRRLQRRLCCGGISSDEADEAVIKNLCKYSYFLSIEISGNCRFMSFIKNNGWTSKQMETG
jgi:hypothetical protein